MMADMTKKHPPTFRLSEDCLRLIKPLAVRLAITETSVVELAIPQLAKAESIESAPAAPKRNRG
jgi:hypothetical protein